MAIARVETQITQNADVLNQKSVDRDPVSVMDAVLSRMGGSGIISISSTDSEQTVGDRFRSIVMKLVTNRAKEPMQIFHWMPAADYKAPSKKRKHPVLRADMDGQPMIGVPYPHYFPEKGGASDLMITTDDGDTLLLQHLRSLSAKPGHTVTFSKGELMQKSFDYASSRSAIRNEPDVPEPDVTAVRVDATSGQERERDKRTRRSEPAILKTIEHFFKLHPDDREDILSRMGDKLRSSIEHGYYLDATGLHRQPSNKLGTDPGTWHGRMLKAAQFIHEWIDVAEDGTVSRRLSNLEHGRHVFGIQAARSGADIFALLPENGRPGKKKKKGKRGWIKE